MTTIFAYCDSLCEPNPGKMEGGIWARDEANNVLFYENVPMGTGTCNQAEYFALLFLLKKIQNAIGDNRPNIKIHSDSQLMTKQVNGLWKVTKGDIKLLYKKVMDFKSIMPFDVLWIPRENNAVADALAQQNRLKGSGRQAMMEDGRFKAHRYTPCVELLSDKEMARMLKCEALIQAREYLEGLISSVETNFDEIAGVLREMEAEATKIHSKVPRINTLADKWIASTLELLTTSIQDLQKMAEAGNPDVIIACQEFFLKQAKEDQLEAATKAERLEQEDEEYIDPEQHIRDKRSPMQILWDSHEEITTVD